MNIKEEKHKTKTPEYLLIEQNMLFPKFSDFKSFIESVF